MNRCSKVGNRLVAVVLLLAMVLPTAFELGVHREGQGQGGFAHVEAKDFQHHADQCLGNAATNHEATSQLPAPVVAVVGPEPVALPCFDAGLRSAEPSLRPSSRAPPASVAV